MKSFAPYRFILILLMISMYVVSCQRPTPSTIGAYDESKTDLIRVDADLNGSLGRQDISTGSTGEIVTGRKMDIRCAGISGLAMLNDLRMRQSHNAVQVGKRSLRLEDGHFVITGEDENSLFGSYNGVGLVGKDPFLFSAEMELEVEGGTGIFEGVRGRLRQYVLPHEGSPSQDVQVKLVGEIRLKDDSGIASI